MKTRALFLFLVSLAPSVAPAAVVATFDFESVAPSQGVNNLVLGTSPTTLSNNGVSMTIRQENGIPFAFNEQTGANFIAQFGTRALSMFNGQNGVADTGAIILDFDVPISMATVEMGDIGQDQDDLLLQAFSGPLATGALVTSAIGTLPGGGNVFGFTSLSVTGNGIRSLRMIGGSLTFPNSVFYDNIVVTAVPEPSVLGLCFLAVTIIPLKSMRRRLYRSSLTN